MPSDASSPEGVYRDRGEQEAYTAGVSRRAQGMSWAETAARIVEWYGNHPRLIAAAREGWHS